MLVGMWAGRSAEHWAHHWVETMAVPSVDSMVE